MKTKDQKAVASRPGKFRTKLLQAGKTATGLVVPAEIVDALGSGKRPPVRVTRKRNVDKALDALRKGSKQT